MPLLAPLFLLGLAAVAIPLLVHLVHREKKDPTAFPSLMFLESTPAPFRARRNLRDPLLFLLRALAVILLVLAFARPVLGRRADGAGADRRRRDMVVLIDRSFSMRIGDRWARAQRTADSVVRSLAQGDRATLIAFDRRAETLTATTGDVAVLQAAIATLRPTDESTRLAPAIAVARQRLEASDAPRTGLVVISDFQRSGWDLTGDSRLTTPTEIIPLDVAGDSAVTDRAVRSVEVRPDRRPGPSQVIVSARITNRGAAVRAAEARLEVAGRLVETRTLDLPRDGGGVVTFAAVATPADAVPARVVLAPDALPGDDAFHFLLRAAPVLPVLVTESRTTPYLARALQIGDAPRFALETRSPSRASAADLAGRRLVIVADGAFPTGIGAARLLRFVEEGGGLLVALGDQASARGWPDAALPLLGGAIGRVVDRTSGAGATLGAVEQRHPALALLSGPRGGDLTAARFLRYRPIAATDGVLMRFDDGTVAMSERAVGRGRVITFGSTLDGSWNDLPRQPAFLPLMQQLARHAAEWRDPPVSLELGASVRPADLAGSGGPAVERWVSTAGTGTRTTIGGDGTPSVLELAEAGIHELRPGGSPGARPLLVAANLASPELDFAPFDALRLREALTAATDSSRPVLQQAATESAAEREARQSTWWYLLLAAALLLVAEGMLAQRLVSRAPLTADRVTLR